MMVTYDSFFSLYMLVAVINYKAVLSMYVVMGTLSTLSKKVITIMCSDIHRLVILPQLYYTPLLVLSSLLEKEPPVLGIRPPSQCEGGGQHHHQQDG